MATSSSKLREDFDSLTGKSLNNIYKRERVYILKYYWNIQALDVDNIILEAIKDLFAGERRYSSDKGFEEALHDVVRSRMSHLLHKRSNKRKIYREVSLEDVPSTLEVQERPLYEEKDCERVWAKLYELIGDDDVVLGIVKIRADESAPKMKRQEMALRLGVPIKKIHNAIKRLDTIRLKLREERFKCQTGAKKQ